MAKTSPGVCRFVRKLWMKKVQLMANETTSNAAASLTTETTKAGFLPLFAPPCSITPRRRGKGEEEESSRKECACAFYGRRKRFTLPSSIGSEDIR